MRGVNFDSYNEISYNIQCSTEPNGGTVSVDQSDFINVKVKFIDIVIDYAKGYMGSEDFSIGPDTADMDVFDIVKGGSFDLSEASLGVTIKNSYGIDARVKITELASFNTESGVLINSDAPAINSSVNISRATTSGNTVFPTYTYIDINQSNLIDLIENMPDKLPFSMDMISNPLGNISSGNDFIFFDNNFKAYIRLEIPLNLSLNDLVLEEYAEVEIDNSEGTSVVNHGTFKLLANNGFPFDAGIQLYLLDDNEIIEDSLLMDAETIIAADVGTNNIVSHKKLTIIEIPVDAAKMKKL